MASRRLLKTVLFLFGCCGWTFLIPPHTFLWYPLGLSHQRLAASTANIRMYSFVSIYYDIYSISQRFARLLSFLWLRAWVMCGFLKVWRVARFDTYKIFLLFELWRLVLNFIVFEFYHDPFLRENAEAVEQRSWICARLLFCNVRAHFQYHPTQPSYTYTATIQYNLFISISAIVIGFSIPYT